MFSVREEPWHGLGVVLERPPATIAEAIELSGLAWRVEREPIAVDRGDAATVDDWWEPRCEEISGYWANVRQDTRQVLGIVGDRYRIVQNVEAFQFVDQLIGSAMHFETAGSLHDGRKVWVLARLPQHIEIGGDPVRCYVLLMNSHDGSTAVVAASTPVRVVCQNTLNWGLERAHQRYSIRHTDKIREHVHQARQVLEISVDYYEQFKHTGDQLASQPRARRALPGRDGGRRQPPDATFARADQAADHGAVPPGGYPRERARIEVGCRQRDHRTRGLDPAAERGIATLRKGH